MATKYDKAITAFNQLDLGDKITFHKKAGEILKASIDEKTTELAAKVAELESVKENI